MNFRISLIAGIMLLPVLGFTGTGLVFAQDDPVVDSATPSSAIQDTYDLVVEIAGSNFGRGAEVRFLETKTENDASGIHVKNVKAKGSSKLIVTLDIDADSYVGATDIEVMFRGRKGKGTTKFAVQAKPNQTTVTCSEVFEFYAEAGGSCTCVFSPSDNAPIYGLLGDCVTSETLFLKSSIRTDGTVQSNGPLFLTLTAVPCGSVTGQDCDVIGSGNFLGSSVISNHTERVGVRFLNIRFADGVTRGCATDADEPDIQTAISFVLDEDTIDDPETNSALQVWDMNIDTHNGNYNDPLCTAVEVVRKPGFDDGEVFANQDWRMMVENVEIAGGSYQQTGIRLEGMHPTQSINPPIVSGNYIGAPDCGSPYEAEAIRFGHILLSDPLDDTSQIAGQLENNIIRMENSDCVGAPFSVGIKVVGEPLYQTSAEVIKNVISGADVGVEVDENVLDVNFSGNTLIGDSADFGICSEASNTSTKGKPNVWSGYDADNEIVYGPCY